MSLQFHPEAEAEFLAAVDWYEERSAGLGGDFAAEIHAAIQRAIAMPLAWPLRILAAADGEAALIAQGKTYPENAPARARRLDHWRWMQ